MKRLFLLILAVGVALAAPTPRRRLAPPALPLNSIVSQASNAAFRDGLHLGRLDAESGRTRHICVGRWSSEINRAWFTSGYQAGYAQIDAVRDAEEQARL